MRILLKGVLVVSVIFFGARTILGTVNEEKKGIVTYADGQVKRRPLAVEKWESAPVNTDVLAGDKVRTYQKSRAELNLAQLDIIRLAPRTTVDIFKLYQETKEKKVQTEIKLEKGEIWASVHKVEMNTQFDISAPITAAAITGTVLRMKVEPDTTTQLKVYRGEVRITNAPLKKNLKPKTLKPHEIQAPHEVPGPHKVSVEEWLYIVKTMQQITVDKHGKVVSLSTFTPKDKDEKTSWVKWNKKRDKKWLKELRKARKRGRFSF